MDKKSSENVKQKTSETNEKVSHFIWDIYDCVMGTMSLVVIVALAVVLLGYLGLLVLKIIALLMMGI